MPSKTEKYRLTPEHEALMSGWAERWIGHAMSTEPMTAHDRAVMREAITGLYRAANLTPPPSHRMVFVPSPFVAVFAGGFAAGLWWLRRQSAATRDATWDATYAATRDATEAATYAATEAATRDATEAATYAATYAATEAATYAATRDATWDATEAATYAATYAATRAATEAATYDATDAATYDATREATWWSGVSPIAMYHVAHRLGHAQFLVSCAVLAYRLWNGGNQWAGAPAWLSFFRHVVQLPLDYSRWQHYEAAAIHGGPRIMHQDFCIVSDRPRILTVDAQRRPHNASGPFCAWADGTALWAWHGVRVPPHVILAPQTITLQHIQQEENAEVRRVLIERYGWDRYLHDQGAEPVSTDRFGVLYRTELDGARIGVVVVTNSTPEPDGSRKRYALLVPPDHETAQSAVASTFGLTADQYQPAMET